MFQAVFDFTDLLWGYLAPFVLFSAFATFDPPPNRHRSGYAFLKNVFGLITLPKRLMFSCICATFSPGHLNGSVKMQRYNEGVSKIFWAPQVENCATFQMKTNKLDFFSS